MQSLARDDLMVEDLKHVKDNISIHKPEEVEYE